METLTKPQRDLLGGGPNANKTASELFAMALPQEVKVDWYAIEEPWTLRQNPYSADPEGDAFNIARTIISFIDGK